MLGVPARIWDQAGVDDIGTVANYLSSFESRCEPFQLPLELRWVNLQQCVLGQDRFRGKVVVVDFFTYCCINCLHILPTLAKLERRWKTSDGLLIVGVHSAKFENEKDAENLANAIIRLNINHPVLADNELELWNRLGIHCWPTVLIVGNGRILFELVGETNINQCLEIYVEEVINYYKNGNRLDLNEVGFKLSSQANESSACTTRSVLRFPGKVAYSQDCTRIAISDSGNNRILVTDVDGDIQVVIGCGIAGFENGTFKEARFCCPQGVCWSLDSSKIFVADTENHALREVNLESKTVTTLAGTGVQGSDATGGKPALEQEISSPWDLTIARITFEDEPQIVADVLFIAMAGSHQIWLLLFQDLKLPKLKKSFTAGCLYAFAGSGTEACQNNVYAHKASFAQPSGVCFAERTQTLYIADAESSSIRQLNVISGAVQHVAGGDRNPQNLFAFGDQDGVGFDAKLQHPLGIALDGDQFLYCADTYNHKIKRINLAICELTTVVAASSSCKAKDGGAASANGGVYFGLSEPGGLCYNPNSGVLLIADTNNHSLVRFNTISKSFDRLELKLPCAKDSVDDNSFDLRIPSSMASSDSNHAGKDVQISLTLNVDPDLELTEGAPQSWELKLANGAELLIGGTENLRGQVKGHHHGKEQEDLITLRLSPEWSAGAAVEGQLVLKLFVCCKSDGCCMQKVLRKEFRLDPQTTNPSTKDNIPIFAYIVECELTK